jgi:hypothetical protein
VVPDSQHQLLASRIGSLGRYQLASFLSYRSNRKFSERLLEARPDILEEITWFSTPIKDDSDASLFAALYEQGLLPGEKRQMLVDAIRKAAIELADASFLDDELLGAVLSDEEKDEILREVETEVLSRISDHVERLRDEWEQDSDPEDYFDSFKRSVKLFVNAAAGRIDRTQALSKVQSEISYAVSSMNEEYQPTTSTSAPTSASTPMGTPLTNLFRDVDQ